MEHLLYFSHGCSPEIENDDEVPVPPLPDEYEEAERTPHQRQSRERDQDEGGTV